MITKCMEISTGHITEETAKRLNDLDRRWNMDLSIYDKEEFGWWIYVNDYIKKNDCIPDDLWQCIQYAKKNGCGWLCLDCDAEVDSEIPTYEW